MARALREHDRQHLDQDSIGVVFRLLLRQAERIDLHAISETPHGRILDAEAVAGDLVPKLDERPHLRELGHEAHACVDEKGDPPYDLGETRLVDLARLTHALATAIAVASA